ncbi:hypothetical protein [Natrinema ejinorense]|uniref:Uncharacterized protein n=1 Tax=Natrinema ejinorense TaxID=373386 RepID=A0A2A5QP46_9EURY|nr:hypothetical protein [Natrinema ejinorense]PCR88612.1 hypothetical protein CP557_21495 [Natrinema ejinorense]
MFDVLERCEVAVEPDATAARIREYARQNPDVRKDEYRNPDHDGTVYGACYALNEAYWNAAGGKNADLGIYCLSWADIYDHAGGTHWYLRDETTGQWIDLSIEQPSEGATIPYEHGRKRAWMYGYDPADRTKRILEALELEVSES